MAQQTITDDSHVGNHGPICRHIIDSIGKRMGANRLNGQEMFFAQTACGQTVFGWADDDGRPVTCETCLQASAST